MVGAVEGLDVGIAVGLELGMSVGLTLGLDVWSGNGEGDAIGLTDGK